MTAEKQRAKQVRECPICGEPAAEPHIPFCSARCKDVDLNRWLNASYVIPQNEVPLRNVENEQQNWDSEAIILPDEAASRVDVSDKD